MSNILFLLSQYELLEKLAQNLSTLDLFHLALTCSENYALIRQSEEIFERLKRVALCDGHGLKLRQEFSGKFALAEHHYKWGPNGRRAHYDEEVEVRVWNLRCDAANALPCLRCNVNVCEECRYIPRVRDGPNFQSRRRPHFDGAWQSQRIICYCTDCDTNVEADLPLRMSEYCDCDQYRRWICVPCKVKEDQPEAQYYRTRTMAEWDWLDEWNGDRNQILWLPDHQQDRAFWCPCSKQAPPNGNIRCAWCRRRHNLNTWHDEDPNKIPYFDDGVTLSFTGARSNSGFTGHKLISIQDPCFPRIARDLQTGDQMMYLDLGYKGPIAP